MSITVMPKVLDTHAARVASVFAPGRYIQNHKLKGFYVWLDDVIKAGADGNCYALNMILDNVAHVSRRIANRVCDMHEGIPRKDWNPLVMYDNKNAREVLEHVFNIFPESESQLACDSLVTLVKYAEYEDPPPHDANSRINTAEMLFEKLDSDIVSHVKANRPNIPTGTT